MYEDIEIFRGNEPFDNNFRMIIIIIVSETVIIIAHERYNRIKII